MRSRELSIVFVVLGCIAGLVAHTGWWTRSTVLDEQGFAETIVDSMDRAELRRALSAVIVENVIEGAEPRLVAARPLVQGAVDTVLSSSAFATALEAAATDIHRSVFHEEAPTVTVQVTRLVTQAQDLVRNVDPELANAPGWQSAANLPLVTADYIEAARSADRLSKVVTYTATAVSIGALALALWLTTARRRTLADIGAGLLAVGGLTIIFVQLVSLEAERRLDGDLAVIADETYAAFTGSLVSRSLWVGAIGLLIIAATSARNPDRPPPSLLAPVQLVRQAVEARELKEHPVLKAIGLLVLGVLLVFFRDEVLPLFVICLGAWISFVGLYGIFDVIGHVEERKGRLLISPRSVLIAVVLVVLVAATLAILQQQNVIDVSQNNDGCNGHKELCERRLDDVVFAATHNSMAAARASNWFSPYQNRTIAEQLDDGIRGLLIDTHYGRRGPNNVTFTANDVVEPQNLSDTERARVASLQQEQAAAASSEREPNLCHAFCELGSTPLRSALNDVYEFLDENEREVVILFVEDKVLPADFARVATETGLADFAYSKTADTSWPTLGEMIDSNKRLVVFGETQGPPPPWYLNGFTEAQDTPFVSPTVETLSCAVNRGEPDSEILLLNHWVAQTPPDARLAARANSRDVLLQTARSCDANRGQLPTIIAVDFYEQGALFEVVDELNQV